MSNRIRYDLNHSRFMNYSKEITEVHVTGLQDRFFYVLCSKLLNDGVTPPIEREEIQTRAEMSEAIELLMQECDEYGLLSESDMSAYESMHYQLDVPVSYSEGMIQSLDGDYMNYYQSYAIYDKDRHDDYAFIKRADGEIISDESIIHRLHSPSPNGFERVVTVWNGYDEVDDIEAMRESMFELSDCEARLKEVH